MNEQTNSKPVQLSGAARRRGVFRAGERVQLTDVKGRKYTINLTREGYFQSTRGKFYHRDLIGKPEGTVIDTVDGHRLLALRPLVSDYVLSMPRGATVIYPKDAAQIVAMADIFPGAHVVEAGLGSGALTLSLLAAIGGNGALWEGTAPPECASSGDAGSLISVERRPEFAQIAQANVTSWFGERPPIWHVELGDLEDVLNRLPEYSQDAVLLDMLAPWENVQAAARALRPGGVILGYVATTTQMSRFVETLRDAEAFTEPESSETMVRTWHVDGLAVRPDHRMVAHTGFLVVARRLAPESAPLVPTKRPAPGAYAEPMPWEDPRLEGTLEERTISEKKLRKVRRDVAHRADVELTGESNSGEHGNRMARQLEAEAQARVEARRHESLKDKDASEYPRGAARCNTSTSAVREGQ